MYTSKIGNKYYVKKIVFFGLNWASDVLSWLPDGEIR
jgi:hypothetical protein